MVGYTFYTLGRLDLFKMKTLQPTRKNLENYKGTTLPKGLYYSIAGMNGVCKDRKFYDSWESVRDYFLARKRNNKDDLMLYIYGCNREEADALFKKFWQRKL